MAKLTINELRDRHDENYEQALQYLSKGKVNKNILSEFRENVDALLNDIVLLSEYSVIISDYRWLSETLNKWVNIYNQLFNKTKRIELHVPNEKMILPTAPSGRCLTEQEIDDRLKNHAEKRAIYRIRELHRDSEFSERIEDWHIAEVMFAKEVIEGSLKFNENISSISYPRLQKIWLSDIKKLIAYFIWVSNGCSISPSPHDRDYQEACDKVRLFLTDLSRKASLSEFLEVKAFIENRYLTNGVLDKSKPDVEAATQRKASRIESLIESMGEQTHKLDNWYDATAYMKLFFENIIPAVLEKNQESVLSVLKGFQFTTTTSKKLHVVDAFEVAVAITFLDANVIEEIWQQHDNDHYPYSAISSYIDCEYRPTWLTALNDEEVDAYYQNERVWLRGIITEKQFESCSNKINSETDRLLFDSLYKESRIVKRLATL